MHRNPTIPLAVRGRVLAGDAAARAEEVVSRRVVRLRDDDEDGAQAVEYAMIGGLGAAAIGLLWTLLKGSGLIEKVLSALLDALVELVTSWF